MFHVAGNTSLWSGGNAQQTLENVDGTRFVVETCLKKKVGRLVHTSSVASWGEQHVVPFDETAPQHAAGSFVNYERTKYLGELEVLKGVQRGLAACIMNPGHIVGRYDANSWARLIRLVDAQKLPGIPPGEGTWAAATEVARAHIAAVEKGRVGERYLLGGTFATFVEAIRIIGQLTGKKVPTRAMPGWVIRALGRVSQWGSYVTKRPPQVTPRSPPPRAAPRTCSRATRPSASWATRPCPSRRCCARPTSG